MQLTSYTVQFLKNTYCVTCGGNIFTNTSSYSIKEKLYHHTPHSRDFQDVDWLKLAVFVSLTPLLPYNLKRFLPCRAFPNSASSSGLNSAFSFSMWNSNWFWVALVISVCFSLPSMTFTWDSRWAACRPWKGPTQEIKHPYRPFNS